MVSASPARCVNVVVPSLISPSTISVSFFVLSLLYLLVVTALYLSKLASTTPAIVVSLLHFFVKHRPACKWNTDDVLTDNAAQAARWLCVRPWVWRGDLSLLRCVYPELTVINCDVLHLFTHISPRANKNVSTVTKIPWAILSWKEWLKGVTYT